MNFHDLFASNGNGDDLPRPNVEMRISDDQGEWTPEQIRGIVGNPIYAGVGPFPALVDERTWVRAAAEMVAKEGAEQFLVNLLFLLRESFEDVDVAAPQDDDTEGPLLTVRNHHTAGCGTPPRVDDRAGERYIGYFENQFGEQWVFTFDRETREATLRGGDIGWEQVCPVRKGRAEGIVLGREEQAWLVACWAAATQGVEPD